MLVSARLGELVFDMLYLTSAL